MYPTREPCESEERRVMPENNDALAKIHERLKKRRKLMDDVDEFERTFKELIKLQDDRVDRAEFMSRACQVLASFLKEKSQDELTLRYNDFAEAVSKGNGAAAEFALRSIFRLEKKC